ncbi:MAG: serine/threonine-protein kinase [Planctomycetota bacterium]|nr:serine/threonine-protein kinase [Planctomycetota bacterium]
MNSSHQQPDDSAVQPDAGAAQEAESIREQESLEKQKTVVSRLPPLGLSSVATGNQVRESGNDLEGVKLGHFQLEELVGGGGMGTVYRATDTSLGRTVAVKVVARDQSADATLARFKNEAQSAARLDHPNIAQVFYVGEDAGWHYIVFEFIDGVNLRDLVQQAGRLSIADAVSFTLQVAEAIDHASRRDVIHRDIKPSNVLVMKDGKVKLVDMGLARLSQVESTAHDLTASGVTLGTFDYISPEQAADPRDADVRSDIYSLGCTLFFILTASPPFPNGTVLQKLLSHSGETPPDVREYRDDVDDSLAQILAKMLAKQPGERYQHPSELCGDLLLLAERLELPLRQSTGTIWVEPRARRRSRVEQQLPWAVPILGLALVILAVFLESRSIDPLGRPEPRFARPPVPSIPVPVNTGGESLDPSVGASMVSPAEARGGALPVSNGPESDVEQSSDRVSDAEVALAVQPQVVLNSITSLQLVEREGGSLRSVAKDSAGFAAFGVDAEQASLELSDTAGRLADDVLVDRILVSDEEGVGVGGAVVVESLQRAFEVAGNESGIQQIELAFNGPRRVTSFEFRLDRISQSELTIRAAPGYRPLLLFHSPRGETRDSKDPAMIQVIGGKLTWEGVHFLFQLPMDQADTQDSATLFSLEDVDSLALKSCTLTIENALRSGVSRHQNVAFFVVVPARQRPPQGPGESSLTAANRIWLEDCLVRGEATLIRTDETVPYLLRWNNGLLVTSERLFWSDGAAQRPDGQWKIRIELDRVTALMARGMGRVEVGADGASLPEVEIACSRCILTPGDAENESVALLEYLGIRRIESARQRLRVEGTGNRYGVFQNRWVIDSAAEESRDYPLVPNGENWYQEVGAQQGIDWSNFQGAGRPHHQALPQDYLVKVEKDTEAVGFNLATLPAVPLKASKSEETEGSPGDAGARFPNP